MDNNDKKLAHNALAVVEHNLDPVISLDLQGKIIQWNPAAENLFGFNKKHALKQHISIIIPQDRADEEQNIRKLLSAQQGGYQYNTIRCHKNGRRIEVNINILPVFDHQHHLIGATKIVKDRTQDQKILREISAKEAKFRALSESSPLGVFSTDPDGKCTYTNQRWQEIFNFSGPISLNQSWVCNIHPEDHDAVLNTWLQCANARSDFDMEFRIKHPSNRVVYAHASARAMFSLDGEISGYIGSVEDITARYDYERSLLNQKQQIQQIIETQSVATFMIDANHKVLHWNKACETLTGVKANTIIGTNEAWRGFYDHPRPCLADLVVDDHKEEAAKLYPIQGKSKLTSSGWHAENWFENLGGKRRYAMFDAAPIYDSEGKIIAAIETLQDTTDQQNIAQELAFKERLLNKTGEIASIGGWEYDVKAKRLTWSEQTRKIHHVSNDYKPTLADSISFYPPTAKGAINLAIEEALKDGKHWDLELLFNQKNGKQIWVRSVGTTEQVNGKTIKLFGAIQNIDEQVQQRLSIEASNFRVNVATDSGHIGIWDWNVNDNEIVWDDAMYALYGIKNNKTAMSFDQWNALIHTQDIAHFQQRLDNFLTNGEAFDTEFRVIWPDKSVHYIRATAQLRLDKKNHIYSVIGACWDITEMREMSNELAEKNEYMHVTMQCIGDAVITTDAKGYITWLNPVAEKLTGWDLEEAKGEKIEHVFILFDELLKTNTSHPVLSCLKNKGLAIQSETATLISKDGSEYGIEDSISAIRNKHHQILGTVIVFRDVTEKRKYTEEIKFKATHDSLTGLVNRSEFEQRLNQLLDKSKQTNISHSLLLIDLDQFKLINDACGHAAGDRLLIEISEIFASMLRNRDTLARLGGDEFAVILERCTLSQAENIANNICQKVHDYRFLNDNKRFRVGASIGLIPVDKRWNNISQAIQTADSCCFAAKQNGRNQVHKWIESDEFIKQRQGDMLWAARIQHAMEQNQFLLYAQRIQSNHRNSNNQHIHAEILLRLKDDYGNIISPHLFIPAAERYHLSTQLDLWVINKTIAWIDTHPQKHRIEMININISGCSISDRTFHKTLYDLLKKTDISIRKKLCLEITETTAISKLKDASNFINQLHDLDLKVALDDFGAGASSFGYLKSMNIDILKIDGHFIKTICSNKLNDSAVRCFVDIANILNIETVAEYIEDKSALQHVKKLGVDYGQGFLIHRPCAIEHLFENAVTTTTA